MTSLPPIRKECPPGACVCERERLFDDPAADMRILQLTKEEEKRLIARLESVSSYADLKAMERRLQANLGITLQMGARAREVRTVRGIAIHLQAQPGLCKKTRQTIPAAIRRCLENNPDIAFAVLNDGGLYGGDAQGSLFGDGNDGAVENHGDVEHGGDVDTIDVAD